MFIDYSGRGRSVDLKEILMMEMILEQLFFFLFCFVFWFVCLFVCFYFTNPNPDVSRMSKAILFHWVAEKQ